MRASLSNCNSLVLAAFKKAQKALLDTRPGCGHWTGELSSSALSTATAVCALALVQKNTLSQSRPHQPWIDGGLRWLAEHANADGGWGDTTRSLSNMSTTALVWAAFGAAGADTLFARTVERTEEWLRKTAGDLQPSTLARALVQRYGKDRTFSIPILTTCALAGRLGTFPGAWEHVLPLPFELAALPHSCFAAARLPVVSYALPALIAIGQARHYHLPSRNPIARSARNLTRARTLALLEAIQPASGGFLEAIPLTSFVTMSLAGSGQSSHPTTRRGVEFLTRSVRPDGSWPIDTNLATWVTTLAINALGPAAHQLFSLSERRDVVGWLLAQQFQTEHSYTHAAPGGWAWTNLPGGVPDADDTAGALLALHALDPSRPDVQAAAEKGIHWLLKLQNKDGGVPTFCRGWGNLAFDRSSPDLTAHALRAWLVWLPHVRPPLASRLSRQIAGAAKFLARTQQPDGSWVPLWFGNQHHPREENLIYGTSRVLLSLAALARHGSHEFSPALLNRGLRLLAQFQQPDGSFAGFPSAPSSVEETACALESIAVCAPLASAEEDDWQKELRCVINRAAQYLARRVEDDTWAEAAPIGFYFAKLWYFEMLYPKIFTVAALRGVLSEPLPYVT